MTRMIPFSNNKDKTKVVMTSLRTMPLSSQGIALPSCVPPFQPRLVKTLPPAAGVKDVCYKNFSAIPSELGQRTA